MEGEDLGGLGGGLGGLDEKTVLLHILTSSLLLASGSKTILLEKVHWQLQIGALNSKSKSPEGNEFEM